ncbi:MAG: hypothetical protein ACW97O_16830 [Candidatus Thorarchaeota archaeon]|jgi:hypothetical protein
MNMDTSKRIRRTITMGSIWLAAVLLFMAFNPVGLGFWQRTTAVIASGFITVGAVALTWINPRI